MLRKFWVLVSLVVLTNSFLIKPVMAEGDEVKNEPVAGAEVTIATFDDTGKLVPIGAPVTVNKDGSFDFDVPSTIPAHKPLFALAQDPSGEGTQQIAAMPMEGEGEITPDQTAIANTFLSLASKATSFTPKDIDASQMDAFVQSMSESLGEVTPAETAGDSITRAAQAMSFNPGAFLNAASGFKVDPQELFEVASVIDEAAAPSSFNPLEALPTISDEPKPGSHITGCIPTGFMKQMPADFNLEKSCPTCAPFGGLEFHDASGKAAPVPKGTYILSGWQANSKVPFPDGAVFPQGVEIPKGFPLSANQIIPPGGIIGDGVVLPLGMKLSDGVIASDEFNQTYADRKVPFQPMPGFVTPPGWGLTGEPGGIFVPAGTAFKEGFEVPAGAVASPTPVGYTAPPLPPGSVAANLQPLPAGFPLGPGFTAPRGFNVAQSGFVPPVGFVQPVLGSKPQDMSAFKADGAAFFDPFAGKGPSADGLFIPPGATFDPTLFASAPPPPQGSQGGAGKPNNGGSGGFDGKGDNGPIAGDGGAAPAPTNGALPGPTAGTTPPTGGTVPGSTTGTTTPTSGFVPGPTTGTTTGGAAPSQPSADKPADAPPPPPPVNSAPPPPPPPPSGGGNPPPARMKARVNTLSVDLTKRASRKLRTIKSLEDTSTSAEVGVKTVLNVTTGAKALGITASEGVYLVGKAVTSATKAIVPILVDPSTSSSSVKVNLTLSDKTVNTVDITLGKDNATQLVTQLDGKVIEMTTANTDVETLGASSVTGYLLAPGTSTQKIMKAVTIKGTVTDGAESGQVISFTLPASKTFADGVYTITFQDGDNTYYGKVTIGTLKARKISGKVLAPNGQL